MQLAVSPGELEFVLTGKPLLLIAGERNAK